MPPVAEHDVLGADVVVADDRPAERIGELVPPRERRGVETCHRLVQPPLQPCNARERRIAHRPRGERRDRHVTLDEREHLAPTLIQAERTLHVIEPDIVQVLQQREHRLGEGARGTADRVADPHHVAKVGDPACERLFVSAHAGRIAAGYASS
jgi:hypothetical protein